MKNLLALVIIVLYSQFSSAKVLKFRAYSFTYYTLSNGQWTAWAPKQDNDALITFDDVKKRITFFGKNQDYSYDIIKIYDKTIRETATGSGSYYDFYSYECVGPNGTRCTVNWWQGRNGQNTMVQTIFPDKANEWDVKSLD